jgi:hypothetical protein
MITHERNETKLQKITEENRQSLPPSSEDVDDFHVLLFAESKEDESATNGRTSTLARRFFSLRRKESRRKKLSHLSSLMADNSSATNLSQSVMISNGTSAGHKHRAKSSFPKDRQKSLPALLRTGVVSRHELPVLKVVSETRSHPIQKQQQQHPVNLDDLEETAV